MSSADIPPEPWIDYLNSAKIQNAIGVDINYTSTNSPQIFSAFDATGDWVYPELLEDLEAVLDYGVRVAMVYGDAVRYFSAFTLVSHSILLTYVGLYLQLVRRRSRLPRAELHAQGRVRRVGIRAFPRRRPRIRREPAVRQLQLHAHLRERARDPLLPAQGVTGVLQKDSRESRHRRRDYAGHGDVCE